MSDVLYIDVARRSRDITWGNEQSRRHRVLSMVYSRPDIMTSLQSRLLLTRDILM